MIINWLRTWLPETPLRLVANVRQMNRIANILNGIQGVNCRIIKPTNAEGKGWMIVVDGSSDLKPEPGSEEQWPTPFSRSLGTADYEYQVYQRMADDDTDPENPVEVYGFDWVRAHE